MLRPVRFGAVVLGLFTVVSLCADAAPMQATSMAQPKKPVATATYTRTKCEWTGALPGIPSTCAAAAPGGTAGKEPTVAQCVDTTFLNGACGKTDPITKTYCPKVLFEDYCAKSSRQEEELVFPAANPKLAPPHGIKPTTAAGALHVPPGTSMGGRQVPYVGLTKNKPPPSTPNGSTALSEGHGATAINVTVNGSGTFGSILAGKYIAKANNVRGTIYNLHQGLVMSNGATNAALEQTTNNLLNQLNVEGLWVGNGQNTAANQAVNSCAEYAYQRWFDYNHFKISAKSLGRNYRGIYALATDPNSPINLEKATLKQFGDGRMPTKWPRSPGAWGERTEALPHNPFFAPPTILVANGNDAKVAAINARIDKYGAAAPTSRKYMKAAGGTRFNTHKVLKQQIENRYHLSDDQLAERQLRQDRYLELILARDKIAGDLACARNPYACCSVPPTNTQSRLDELLMQVQGWAVINPDPTRFANWGVDVGDPQVYDTWTGMEQALLAGSVRAMKGSPAGITGGLKVPNVGASMQFKQKAAAGGQASQTSSAVSNVKGVGGKATWANNQVGGFGTQTCESSWASKRAYLENTMNALAVQLSDLVIKEYDLGADGCLAEPPGGDLGNSCDWSYEKFSKFVMSYFDGEVTQDFQRCNESTLGDFNNVKDPNKQTFIYPCEVRHNFSEDQHDVAMYIDAVPQKGRRFECEGKRAQRDVDNYLKQNTEKVKQIPIISEGVIGESAGDNWSIGDPNTFGAFLKFGLGWDARNGGAKMNDGAWCQPVGKSTMTGSGGFHFFGNPLEVIDGSAIAETTASTVYYQAEGRYRDFDSPTTWKAIFEKRARAPSTQPAIQLPSPFIFLGDARADFWTSIGPIPLHIFFGGTAMAGLILKEFGTVNGPAACSDKTKASEGVTYGMQTGAYFEPFARADAYGDASLDVGVAAAGLHIDLLLMRLGLPTGSMLSIPVGSTAAMQTGSDLSVDALSGRVSAYVRVGVPPASATYEATLFAWDGLHDTVKLWGSETSVPIKLLSWASDKTVDLEEIKCIQKNNNPHGSINRTWCLKNPTTNDACSPYPKTTSGNITTVDEAYCDSGIRPYKLKGNPPPP